MRDGIAELRYGALGKGRALPIPLVTGSLARSVRNSSELAFQIAAALIAGAGQVRQLARESCSVLPNFLAGTDACMHEGTFCQPCHACDESVRGERRVGLMCCCSCVEGRHVSWRDEDLQVCCLIWQVAPRTKLLLLDGRGSARAVGVARALRGVGLPRAYVVQVPLGVPVPLPA
jgi:hypothetical protein